MDFNSLQSWIDNGRRWASSHLRSLRNFGIFILMLALGAVYWMYQVVASMFGLADAPFICSALCLGPFAIALLGASKIWQRLLNFINKYALNGGETPPSQEAPPVREARPRPSPSSRPAAQIVAPVPDPPVSRVSVPASERIETISEDELYLLLSRCYHSLTIGSTGGGKTTMLHWFAVRKAQESGRRSVAVIDPDAARGQWPGTMLIGGENSGKIEQALKAIDMEFAHRQEQALAHGFVARDFDPLYIIFDEYHVLQAGHEVANELVNKILRRGRRRNMHLFLGTQDAMVRTLGFERQNELKSNFSYIIRTHFDQENGRRLIEFEATSGTTRRFIAPELPDPKSFIKRNMAMSPTSLIATSYPNGNDEEYVLAEPEHRPVITGDSKAATPVVIERSSGDHQADYLHPLPALLADKEDGEVVLYNPVKVTKGMKAAMIYLTSLMISGVEVDGGPLSKNRIVEMVFEGSKSGPRLTAYNMMVGHMLELAE